MKQGIQGTVTLEATLDATGAVADARVLSGPAELRRASLESVLEWHFANGAAGETRQVNIAFQPTAGQQAVTKGEAVTSSTGSGEQTVQVYFNERGQMAEREQLVAALREQIARFSGQSSGDSERKLANVRAQLEDAERGLANAREGNRSPAGRKLIAIDINGLSDSAKASLIAKLPIHVGDVLTATSIESAKAAVTAFDDHLEYGTIFQGNEAVEFWVRAPGAGVGLSIRR